MAFRSFPGSLSNEGRGSSDRSPLLYVAKYKCELCGHKWKLRKTSGESKKCPIDSCQSYMTVSPYKKLVIDKLVTYTCPSCKQQKKEKRCAKDVNQVPYCTVCRCDMEKTSCKDLRPLKRMFGEFVCTKCSRNWKSGNSWEGKGQICQRCNVMIYPCSLRPLEARSPSLEHRKPHDEERCQMCKELGQNCRQFNSFNTGRVAREDELPDDDDDDRSVFTDTSSAISDTSSTREISLSPNSGELTPTEERDGYLEDEIITSATQRLARMLLSDAKD